METSIFQLILVIGNCLSIGFISGILYREWSERRKMNKLMDKFVASLEEKPIRSPIQITKHHE